MRIAALVIGFAILAAVLWAASELHYQSCIDEASAKRTNIALNGTDDSYFGGDTGRPPQGFKGRAVAADVSDCSRLPF